MYLHPTQRDNPIMLFVAVLNIAEALISLGIMTRDQLTDMLNRRSR